MRHKSLWNVFFRSTSKKRTARIVKSELSSRLLRLESLEERQLLSVTAVEYDQIRNNYPTFQLSDNINDNNIIELTSLSATNIQNAINQATQTDFDDLIVIRHYNGLNFENELITIDLDDGSHGKLSIVCFDANGTLSAFDDLIDSHHFTVKGDGFFNGQTWFAPMKDFVFDTTTNDITPQTVEAKSLIGLNELRDDSRFSFAQGTGYTTVIIDTGINRTHNYFKDSSGNSRIVYQYDFADGDSDATDVSGHGTNVAGIAAGTIGVASDANIIALKVGKDDGSISSDAIQSALEWVVANQEHYSITTVNISLGFNNNYSSYHAGYLHNVLTNLYNMGVIVCVAAGNDYYTYNSEGVMYPAAEESVVSVGAVFDANVGKISFASGAVSHTTTADQIACFSQRSSTMLSIMAPGGRLTSAGISSNTATSSMFGTSQASPVMAGVAVLAQDIANYYLNRPLTVSEFKSLIQETGKDIYDGTYDDGAIENDNVTNTEKWYKRIDVFALAEAIYDMRGIVVDSLEDTIDATDDKTTLREAIAIAQTGDTITFKSNLNGGTITLAGTQLSISKAITIDASSLSDGITIDADQKSRIFSISGGSESSPVNLIGLTITRGKTTGNGGGIYNSGILVQTNCTVSGNTTSKKGGGVYNYRGTVTIANGNVSENTATSGGGITNDSGSLNLHYSNITDNIVSEQGGGIAQYNNSVSTITNCLIANNTTLYANGGGIDNVSGVHHIINCKFLFNHCGRDGGGIASLGTTYITNTLVAKNTALTCGGIYSPGDYNGKVFSIKNSIITENTVTDSSPGYQGYYSKTVIYNSILVNNYDVNNVESNLTFLGTESVVTCASNILSPSDMSYNTSGLNYSYNATIPLFSDVSNDDYTLAVNSQAINKGNNAYAVDASGNPLPYDLAGNARIVNNVVDIGAYEYQGTSQTKLATPVITGTSSTTNSITINWSKISNASSYTIEYKKSTASSYTKITDISSVATSYTISGLSSNTTYNIRMKAIGNGTNYLDSDYSTVQTFKTLPLPSTDLIVDSTADTINANDGVTTLREAIAMAETGGTIIFASSLAGKTITLSEKALTVSKGITIDATSLGESSITISGGNKTSIFNITGGSATQPVILKNLQLTSGKAKWYGGIVVNTGYLTVHNSRFFNSNAYYGGAVSNNGTLSLVNCNFMNNYASMGGAIYNRTNGILTISGTFADSNTANNHGGFLYSNGTSVAIYDSVFNKNIGKNRGGVLYLANGTNTVDFTNFTGNSANNYGGIAYNTADSTFTNCTIIEAQSGYGGSFVNTGYLTLDEISV